MNHATAVENRAREMGGVVVEMTTTTRSATITGGIVHWCRRNEHMPNGEEHITHAWFVRPGWTVAEFEAGTYGTKTDAVAAFARRAGGVTR